MTSSLFKGCFFFFAPRRCVLIVADALIVNALRFFIQMEELNNQCLPGRVFLMIIHGVLFHINICIFIMQ